MAVGVGQALGIGWSRRHQYNHNLCPAIEGARANDLLGACSTSPVCELQEVVMEAKREGSEYHLGSR